MKITVNQGNKYITLTTENREDDFRLGRISGLLEKGTFAQGESTSMDLSFDELVKALARE